jgi:hypothetical protein
MAVRSKRAEENIKLVTEKQNKCFFTDSILLRGVVGGLRGSHVPSGDLRGSRVASKGSLVASGGRGWPRGLRSSLGAYGWPSWFTDGLGGCGWLYGVMGGHGG